MLHKTAFTASQNGLEQAHNIRHAFLLPYEVHLLEEMTDGFQKLNIHGPQKSTPMLHFHNIVHMNPFSSFLKPLLCILIPLPVQSKGGVWLIILK